MKMFVGLCMGMFFCHVYYSISNLDYSLEIAEHRVNAEQANELTEQLLAKGRFIRKYDPKNGASQYTFYIAKKK